MALINCPECGKEVSPTAIACPNCGFGVKKHFDDIELARLKQERMELAAIKRKKRNKILKIVIPIAIILVAAISAIVINNKILSERTIFASEDEMRDYLNGYWVERSPYSYTDYYSFLYIDRHIVEYNSCSTDWAYADEVKLYPKRGYFEADQHKYIIGKDGNLLNVDYDDVYEKTFKAPDNFKPCSNCLTISEIELNAEGNVATCTGFVINNGNKNYRYVEIRCDFKDSNGEILDSETRTVYLEQENGNEYIIKPGDKAGFNISYFDNIDKLASCSVYIIGYNNF